MDKVEVGALGNPLEQGDLPLPADRIPSHVGDLEARRETPHPPREDVKAAMQAELLALRAKELEAKTDAQKRFPTFDPTLQRLQEALLPQIIHPPSEGAHPGQDGPARP